MAALPIHREFPEIHVWLYQRGPFALTVHEEAVWWRCRQLRVCAMEDSGYERRLEIVRKF